MCIRDRLGYEITVTGDHPLLTPYGMKEAKKFRVGDRIAIYPFKGVKYEKPKRFLILETVGNEHRDRELKKRGLLPLYSDNPLLPYIVKLVGYLTGDGNIGKNKVNFYGSKEGLEELKKDIEKLGFKPCGVYTREKTVKVYGKTYKTTENYLYVSSKALADFFEALGVPRGKKTEKDFEVPNWLLKLPKWLKRLYLASLFGAEMNKPQTHKNGYNFLNLTFSVSKKEEYLQSGLNFIKQIARLLEEFGIKTQKVEVRKDRNLSLIHI
jgi:tRNA-splicing ligase RtcB